MAGRVEAGAVVTIAYELRDADGALLDDEGASVAYLHGGHGGLFPKVEAALEGAGVGHELTLTLEPEDAFGDYDATLLRVESRDAFPEVLTEGMRFEGVPGDETQEGDGRIYTVTGIADEQVVVDGNHPLAGERLWFRCRVTDVRPATADEIRHGHAHGEHAPEDEAQDVDDDRR
ncbi:MAG: peptidylprolyl isomerase [Betaproteobacteria bacterium]|nr:peptidylprolyl isomerase [Betaproteobacteria bacterium]